LCFEPATTAASMAI